MPSTSNEGNARPSSTITKNTEPAAIQPKDMSDSRMVKGCGFRSMYDFMPSYGLKMHNDEDYEEGKQIIQALREAQQQQWNRSRAGSSCAGLGNDLFAEMWNPSLTYWQRQKGSSNRTL